MNKEIIHQEMLSEIDDSLSKEKGELIYEATRPSAIQLEKAYQKNAEVKNKLSIENLQGDELAARVKERTGITRKKATFAIGKLKVLGTGTVNIGDLFETESGIQFRATETVTIIENGLVNIQCLQAGTIGNLPSNRINKIPVTLNGINSVNNENATYDGFEAESDTDLLQRYYDRIRTPATSGNKYHYLNWSKSVSGVGDVKIFPLYYGDNTVRVVVIDVDKKPASSELIGQVQDYIDPNSSGLGEGQSPIGAFCTVVSATGKEINISFNSTLENGYTAEQVQEIVSVSIANYLREIAFKQDFVSYAQIGSIIINTEGVLDYTGLTVNGGTENISIENDEVAILGGAEIV